MEPPVEPSLHFLSPSRRGTVSTVSSEKQSLLPLPTGEYSLPAHGTCPRCYHYHKAAPVRLVVYEGVCEASTVPCAKCGQKWFTLGGSNVTQISLLSRCTTNLDQDEINFRNRLFRVFRPAASATPPTNLASVPESISRGHSRDSSVRPSGLRDTSEHVEHSIHGSKSEDGIDHGPEPIRGTSTSKPSSRRDIYHQPQHWEPAGARAEVLLIVKRKLEKTLAFFKRLRPRKLEKHRRDNPKGKDPVAEPPSEEPDVKAEDSVEVSPSERNQSFSHSAKESDQTKDSTTDGIDLQTKADEEQARKMTFVQRKAWFREQITAYKCRRALDCSCPRRHSDSSIGRRSSVQDFVRLVNPDSSRQCSVLAQTGAQFDHTPVMHHRHTDVLSISATRMSEADTAIDSHTRPSSPRHSRIESIQRQAHRSMSPRPASRISSRQSLQWLRADRAQRHSADSTLCGSTVHNAFGPGRRGRDRHSIGSLLQGSDSPDVPPVHQEHSSNNINGD